MSGATRENFHASFITGTKSGKTVERAIQARLLIPPVSFLYPLSTRLGGFFCEENCQKQITGYKFQVIEICER